MLLVSSVIEATDDGVTCTATVGDHFPFLRDDGEADITVCVELIAQAAGCCAGLVDRREGRAPQPGLLVGFRDASFLAPCLRRGDELVIHVRRQWVRLPVASFIGDVERGNDVLARVEITVVSIDPNTEIDLGGG